MLGDFAERTGLTSDRSPNRYLWTDAFAVCAFLGSFEETGEARHRELAVQLVDQVHHTLGRHHPDDPRSGWISGLSDDEAEEHPTAGGLRIGKELPERGESEPYDPRGEWDRDGQYYHYLTRWMHALNRVWRVTGEPRYHRWAVELAEVAHDGFVTTGTAGTPPRIAWKMSTDLSRPLVPSQGQHDPLDGRISIQLLRATRPEHAEARVATGPLLGDEAAELEVLCRGRSWVTEDPLGAGGLLVDAVRAAQLREMDAPLPDWLDSALFSQLAPSVRAAAESIRFDSPPDYRLGFRELGLAIGLRGAERLPAETVPIVRRHEEVADRIVDFWEGPERRSAESWTGHRDINDVMLAVALEPAGYLDL